MNDALAKAIEAFKRGSFVIVMDDYHRENEGDLIMAAQFATPKDITLMLKHTTGILCAPLTPERAKKLDLPLMVGNSTDPKKTAFTITVDAAECGTGVSSVDRALTFRQLARDDVTADDFRRPGHIFPLIARAGGVLERRGHTEASIELCKFAGLTEVAVIGELMNPDGTMSRLDDCRAYSEKYDFPLISVEEIAQYRRYLAEQQCAQGSLPAEVVPAEAEDEKAVELVAECSVPIQKGHKFLGTWTLRCYKGKTDGCKRHIALIKGDLSAHDGSVLTRIHSECFTGDVIGSCRCDCGQQLEMSLATIAEKGVGVVIYVDGHEGRGIGLINKLKAYALQTWQKLDTYEANEKLGFPHDIRDYTAPLAILQDLGIKSIDILTNNPTKVHAFKHLVNKVVPLLSEHNEHNTPYLEAKKKRGHFDTTIVPEINQSQTKEVPLDLPIPANVHKLRVAILKTCWNETLVGSLVDKCKQALLEYKIDERNITETKVPGAFELPYLAQKIAASGMADVVMCFGVLIKGETKHFENISKAVAQGLMQVQITTGVPVIYGVLNCLSTDQASARVGPDSPLPLSLALTAIQMGALKTDVLPMHNKDMRVDANSVVSSPPVAPPCSQS